MRKQAMTESSLKRTRYQRRVIDAFMECGTVKGVVEKTGINRRTIQRYLREPAFMAELERQRQKTLAVVRAALAEAAGESVVRLRQTVKDKDISPGIRVRASRIVLDHAFERPTTIELGAKALRRPLSEEIEESLDRIFGDGETKPRGEPGDEETKPGD